MSEIEKAQNAPAESPSEIFQKCLNKANSVAIALFEGIRKLRLTGG